MKINYLITTLNWPLSKNSLSNTTKLTKHVPKYKNLCNGGTYRQWVLLSCFTNEEKKKWKCHSAYFPEMSLSHRHLPVEGQTPCPAAGDESLTNTQDVETEPLRSRLVNQLVRKTVKSNMAREGQVSELFILELQRGNVWESMNCATWGPHVWTTPSPFLSSWRAWEKELASLPTPSLASTQLKGLTIQSHVLSTKSHPLSSEWSPAHLTPGYTCTDPGKIELLEVTIRYVVRDIKNSNHSGSFEHSRKTFKWLSTHSKN